ncbi:MAG: hypothetical protein JFAIHJKO_02243 [Pyrinomonadaceae bacterium]|nr:hypothetical protein [Pyrinomonadaceae bacterium]
MPKDPIDHISAIACTGRADLVPVNEREFCDRRYAVHDVRVSLAAPVGGYVIDVALAVAGGPARIRHKDDISAVREDLRVPTVAPIVAPRALWAAVDQHNERILLTWVEIRRL